MPSRLAVPLLITLLAAGCRGAGGAGAPAALAPDAEGARNRGDVPGDSVIPTSAFTGDTLEWVVVAAGRAVGRMRQWGDTGFTTVTTWTYRDRGRGPTLRQVARVDKGELPVALAITGTDYLGAPRTETLAVDKGVATWRTETGVGRGAAGRAVFYSTAGIPEGDAMLARAILASRQKSLPLLPTGTATLTTVGARKVQGAELTITATLHLIAGLAFRPVPVWLDASGRLFASLAGGPAVVRRGFERTLPELRAVQDSVLLARDVATATTLALRPAGPLVIRRARLFDPRSRRATPGVAIVIRGDRVLQVVRDSGFVAPPGATIVDARDQFVMPGLWDMHVHADDGDGLLHLAAGVTSVRDMGGDLAAGVARRARWAAGTTLGPRLHLAGVLDGPGQFAAPTPMLVATPDSARAVVQRWADAGAVQVKVYSSLDPRLFAGIAREAKARGLRVSGHVPYGMTAARMVREGADELQHANFLLLDALADSAYDTRTPARFTAVARRGGTVDLQGPEIEGLVALLRERRTVVDPTLAVFETMFTTPPGQLPTGLAAVAERLPPVVRASLRGGGLAVTSPAERRRFTASFATMQRLVKKLYDAEVPLVAGTDALAGFTLHRELELHAQAGIPNADVLHAATLGAATILGRDSVEGRIAPGMRADLLVVDGDPLQFMASLRRTTLVVKDGMVLRPDRLYAALGVAPAVASLPVTLPKATPRTPVANTKARPRGPASRTVPVKRTTPRRAASPGPARSGDASAGATVTEPAR